VQLWLDRETSRLNRLTVLLLFPAGSQPQLASSRGRSFEPPVLPPTAQRVPGGSGGWIRTGGRLLGLFGYCREWYKKLIPLRIL